jgi:acyl-CoA dehydrogenase
MDFHDTPDEAAFRDEARSWLDGHAAPRRRRDGGLAALMSEAGDDPGFVTRCRAWQRTLHDGGWAAITWPKEHGGRDASFAQLMIWEQEYARYDLPPRISAIGLGLIGPTIIAHGTEEQKRRYLPRMLSGDDIWCQLWSEPSAGSDLASLRTRAVPTDAGWIINGQKVWTSGAHYSSLGLLIARTDPDVGKHRGLSVFVVDMRAPGVGVRPLRQMTGGANFNEVFLDDVAVPADHVVGDVNDGWRVALTTLMNERFSAAAIDFGSLVEPLLRLARNDLDPIARQAIAHAYVRARALTFTSLRSLSKMAKGSIPGPEGSVLKLVWAGVASEIAEAGTHIVGPASLLASSPWALDYLFAPGIHIGGGTDEVQRNIIGERVLGLPREPKA